MKKLASLLMLAAIINIFCSIGAQAADYTFKKKDTDDFYRSTLYEDIYGSTYNYGDQNVTDFYDVSMLPGLVSPTPQTAGSSNEFSTDLQPIYGLYDSSRGINEGYFSQANYSSELVNYTVTLASAFTSASELKRSDGSIGTLSIPSLSINMKAYEGTASDSMNRGLGHFPESSGWDGNIALCGHNRGATYTIGSIKDMRIGDTIQYTTTLGTRTYFVSYVGEISGNDWSYLSKTSDNRITLITCLANQPEKRICVQAIEIT